MLRRCGRDVAPVGSQYARQLTGKAYLVYLLMQIDLLKAAMYVFLPTSIPYLKFLLSGIPMAIVYAVDLRYKQVRMGACNANR